MKLNTLWISGIVIALIGGIISWHALLTESDFKKRSKKITIGTAISMFGVGMFVTSSLVFHKFVKT